MIESRPGEHPRMFEVESHRVALWDSLELSASVQSSGRKPRSIILRYVAPAAVAALLAVSVFLTVYTGNRRTGTKDEASNGLSRSNYEAATDMMVEADMSPEPAATFESIDDAEKVVQMRIMRPTYTDGGHVKQVVIGTYTNQEPAVYVTYDNGLAIMANVSREPLDYQGRIDGLKWNDAQVNKGSVPPGPPSYYPVDIRGGKGMVWGRGVYFWENSIEYTLTIDPKNEPDNRVAVDKLLRVAKSLTGPSRVPPVGAKLSIPPNYVDLQSALRRSGIEFRWPRYSAGATVKSVYASASKPSDFSKLVIISYSNGVGVSFEEGTSRITQEAESQPGIETRKIDIAGHQATLTVPAAAASALSGGLSIEWRDGKATYRVSFGGPSDSSSPGNAPTDVEAAIDMLTRIAKSMYD